MTLSSAPTDGTSHERDDARESANTSSTATEQKPLRLRAPRSLPPWIDSYEEKYGEVNGEQLRLLYPPARAAQPQHNSTPSATQRRISQDGFIDPDDPLDGRAQGARARVPHFLRYGRAPRRGRKWDHLRSAEPVIVPGYYPTVKPASAWQEFLHSSAWGHMPNEESQIVGHDELNKLQPTFNNPIDVPYNPHDAKTSRRKRTLALYKRIWNMAVRHSLAPLLFRLTVMITSIVALGIAARIHELEDKDDNDSAEETQSIVAVVVDCVAIPYIGYMIWDEYTGKPLGLRSAVSKMSLILLDLIFIIFKSASTALAFESLIYHNLAHRAVRHFSEALAAFMLIGLIAWTLNFTVNIFRTVERLGGGEDDEERD